MRPQTQFNILAGLFAVLGFTLIAIGRPPELGLSFLTVGAAFTGRGKA